MGQMEIWNPISGLILGQKTYSWQEQKLYFC